jgi:hypothetical protein
MAAFDPATLDRWRALAIVDRDGTTVGTISEFYLDRETGHPTWALVTTGLFGATQTFVPLVHATEIGDGLQVPYEKRHIKDAPRIDLHDELSPDEEAALFAHYGVDYQPSPDPVAPTTESSEAEQADTAEPESAEAVSPDQESVEGPGPAPLETEAVPPDQESVEGPGPVPAETEAVPPDQESVEGPGAPAAEQGSVEGPAAVDADQGSVQGPGPVPTEAGAAGLADREDDPAATGATGLDPAEPGTFTGAGPGFGPGSPEAGDGAPDEPGSAAPDDATLVAPGGFGSAPEHHDEHPADPDAPGTAQVGPDADPATQTPPADPDLSRPAAVEPGLPGSTAASPGPVPTTVGKDDGGDPAGHRADDAVATSEEATWPPGFDPNEPADRSAASDRWREAKLAAERNRIARAAAAQPEERSPLERARRRLERLVGVGQDHADPDDFSPADREAAERARRARLGLEDDDPHHR